MTDTRLDVLHPVLRSSGLDAIAIVPGANFRRIFGADFHQNERPLVVIAQREHAPVAIVPNLEMASFAALNFEGEVYDWRDETGYQGAFEAAARHLRHVRTIGVEGQSMRVFVALALNAAMPQARIVDIHSTISSIRLHKQAADVSAMRKAIELSERALEATLGEVRAGMLETEVEALLLKHLFACGSDGLAFGPIVAAGDNSAKPHAKARPDYRIKRGDSLLFDFGGAYGGYCADITRTFFVQEVSERDRDFYNTVLAANEAGRAAIRPGATAHHVDDVVQKVLEESRFSQFRRHKTGHGLGLEVHEDPYIMRGNHRELEAGMVFTVEPGLYRLGEAGVRIEDDMLVTAEGAESLTSFPRELRLVG
ncbi:MAG: Xaa-Pro peptidase family protein [Nitratireductor sp.]|nr:Xaa-Pro peptidase family protein [Nitratireductor sp.]